MTPTVVSGKTQSITGLQLSRGPEGVDEGSPVTGWSVGSALGEFDGARVGALPTFPKSGVGTADGLGEGTCDGLEDGCNDGADVGH